MLREGLRAQFSAARDIRVVGEALALGGTARYFDPLTPAPYRLHFYETEAGQFCCDLCPDEEKNHVEVTTANKKIVQDW